MKITEDELAKEREMVDHLLKWLIIYCIYNKNKKYVNILLNKINNY